MKLSLLLLACLSFSLGACGSVDDAPTTDALPEDPSAPSSDPGRLSARDQALLGSWELVFDAITPSDRASLSLGNRARLDIRDTGYGSLALRVTPRWGDSCERTTGSGKTRIEEGALVLESDEGFACPHFAKATTLEAWKMLRFARAPSGELAGSFEAVGFVEPGQPAFTATGTIRPDVLAPELRLAPPPASRGGTYLPWDALVFAVAEPIRTKTLALQLAAASPELRFANALTGETVEGEGQFVIGTPRRYDWTSTTLRVDGGQQDPSGNALAPFEAAIAVHAVGEAHYAHDFSKEAKLALWGGAALVEDPRCLGPKCILLPAASQATCNPAGIAGLLSTGNKTHARVRVLASDAPDGAPPKLAAPISFGVRAPGIWRDASVDPTLVRTGTVDLPWASAWTTITIQESPSSGPMGFEIVRRVCDHPSPQPIASVNVAILVDRVWIE